MVMSEINTNITVKQIREKVFTKSIGDFTYLIAVEEIGDYRIVGKKKI